MNRPGKKKKLNLLVLEVLKNYSDEEHHLKQQEIVRLLKRDYDLDVDRRSVRSNIESLIEIGYDIDSESGYYLSTREFEDAELKMLIDSVLFSRILTEKESKRLIEKLKGQSNKYFEPKIESVKNLPNLQHAENGHILYSIDAIAEAIGEKKKISFIYNSYGFDKKLHPKRKERAVVNPYLLIETNGHYYLVGNYDQYDDLVHFRVDKITSVHILEKDAKDPSLLSGAEEGLDISSIQTKNIYMFGGDVEKIVIRAKNAILDDIIDFFGKDFEITFHDDDEMMVELYCNVNDFFYWALQFGPSVEVVEPEALRSRLRDAAKDMYEKYK